MMAKYAVSLCVAVLSLLPVLVHAAEPMARAGMQALSVQCPQRVEGVSVERIHAFVVPSGWQDDPYPGGGYSGIGLHVTSHFLMNNGKTMVCVYGAGSGNSALSLIRIAKSVPGNKTCSKGANYSFNCKLKAPKLRR